MNNNQVLNNSVITRPPDYPPKVLQFGGGNFLRAFANWMIEILNEKQNFAGSTIIVKPTGGGDYTALREQDGLFHVWLEGLVEGSQVTDQRLITNVQRIIHPYREFAAFLDSAKIPDIRFVISNTTESGIRYDASDRMEDQPAGEFPGKLTQWLYQRYQYFEGHPDRGCIVLPCELIGENGSTLKKCILQYARLWNLEEEFDQWVEKHNVFCNTLVDRIVSGYPKEKAQAIPDKLGYRDSLLVAGEYYHSWVIQAPAFVAEEIPLQQAGLNVRFVRDLSPHREIKVRLLNGAHTALVPVGYLAGLRSVRAGIEHPVIGSYISQLLYQEVVPYLSLPEEEARKFAADVIERFKNPAIHHRLISIALNSTSKFVTRLLPSLKAFHTATGKLPWRICFALAALIRFYEGDLEGETIALQDDPLALDIYRREWDSFRHQARQEKWPLKLFADRILASPQLWGEDLTQIEGLSDLVHLQLAHILNGGTIEALAAYSHSSSSPS